MAGIGGMPVKTKDGSWYSSSVQKNDIKHALRKGPLNWSGNPNTTTMFSPMVYRNFTLFGPKPLRLRAFYKLKNQNHGQYMTR